ncbi:MAG: hypothetical protein JSV33_01040 [bacterium]|nr:MAG: hypothetical protein JSV33_01040 [bacterium]
MFYVVKHLLAIIVISCVVGCATTAPPALRTGTGGTPTAAADSIAGETYEELFLELYSDCLSELERKEKDGRLNIHIIEARSIIQIAEELYLEGNVLLAVQLLNEAEQHLRQAP